MGLNKISTINFIAKWLHDYLFQYGKSSVVIYYNNNIFCSLLLQICEVAAPMPNGPKIHVVSQNDINNQLFGKTTFHEVDNIYPLIQANIIADKNNGVVLSSVCKTFGLYFRDYNKLDFVIPDLFPIFDLEFSDILQMTDGDDFDKLQEDLPILLEWCNSMEDKYGIVTAEELPNKHHMWQFFTQDQKTILARVHQREKKTRHKRMTKPFPICKR